MIFSRLGVGAALILAIAGPGYAQSFDDSVRPLLERNCVECHGSRTRTSGLSVLSQSDLLAGGARQGPAVVAGKPASSPLVKMLRGELQPRMPVGLPPLPESDIQAIARWIQSLPPAAGPSAESKWWAFVKPARTVLPAVRNAAWARNGVDRFVLAKLESKKLTASPEAPKLMLLRRACFDVLGVPPTPAETRGFLDDASPDAYEQLVDRLLKDSRFGERWGRHWLDLARYADTQGFEADRENYHIWRYRDYVIDAFNNDKPYDQFVREQLAADEMPAAPPEARIATAFLRLTPRYQTTNVQESRQQTLDEITATAGSVFLGLTVKCAQCHDHKYDPIPQKDFYRLQAFFAAIEMADAPAPFTSDALRQRMESAARDTRQRLAEAQKRFDDYQQRLLARMPASQGPIAAEPAAADGIGAAAFARKLTPPVVALERRISRAIANGAVPNTEDATFTLEEKQKYLDLLTYVDGTRGGRDMGSLQRELRRHLPQAHMVRNTPNDSSRPHFPVTFVRVNGDFSKPGEWVLPGFPSAVTGNQDPAQLTRDQFGNIRGWRMPLANWIAGAGNPLTARVMANRVWQHLLGAPIVATPSDFGRNGAPPTHPELLDHLAIRFVENKWSIKALIREIMLSATYRQTSLRRSTGEEAADPSNQLLWRQNRKPIEGEILRDSVLEVSGGMNRERGGPGVMVKLPAAIKERMTIKNIPSWIPDDGPASAKRSIYVFQRRQLEVPFLSVMDAPVFHASCERRAVSTTAVQALTMLNDEFVAKSAREFAARVRGESGPDAREQVEAAWRLALARTPSAEELARAAAFLSAEKQDALEGLCRILFNTNEFLYVD